MTPTLGYRIDLWKPVKNDELPGFYDGRVSFRRSKEGVFSKNLTIVEGPFVTMAASDRPGEAVIAIQTDEPCYCSVYVWDSVWTDKFGALKHKCYAKKDARVFSCKVCSDRHEIGVIAETPGTPHVYGVECDNNSCTGSAGNGQRPLFRRQSGLMNRDSVPPFGRGFSEA